jgi:peptidoglycan/LPS O-acetylase OafA/YrhL
MKRLKTRRYPLINGRRGAFQILFAGVYLIVGYSFITTPSAGTRQASLRWLTDYAPIEPFAALWIVAGVLGVVAAFKCRPNDWFGFSALVFAPAVWGALFFIGGITGTPTAWISAAVYWLFAAAPMIVSGMQGESDRDARMTREP